MLLLFAVIANVLMLLGDGVVDVHVLLFVVVCSCVLLLFEVAVVLCRCILLVVESVVAAVGCCCRCSWWWCICLW